MDAVQAIKARRAIRLYQDKAVEPEIMDTLLGVAGLYPSGANLQPLKFRAVTEKAECDAVFSCLKWAGYLPGFEIREDQRPKAYIIVVRDKTVPGDAEYSAGAATNALCIAATACGLGSCILGIGKKKPMYPALGIDEERYEILYAVALGYADHEADAVPMEDGSVKYYRSADGAFHVPKRQDILL